MIPNYMRFMHNNHIRHAFRETTTSRFEPPDCICRDCGGEKHYCGRISAATEPACCEPRVAARPGDVSRVLCFSQFSVPLSVAVPLWLSTSVTPAGRLRALTRMFDTSDVRHKGSRRYRKRVEHPRRKGRLVHAGERRSCVIDDPPGTRTNGSSMRIGLLSPAGNVFPSSCFRAQFPDPARGRKSMRSTESV